MLNVAIVADDLTGAMDAAAPFAGRGLATRVFCRPDAVDDERLADPCDVVAVNAASRYLDADRAAERTAHIACRLQHLAPALAFKKIDSTLRGNVAAEVMAAARAFERASVLLTPAFPAQGRTMRGGVVYVRGRALPETPFAADRQPPPRDLAAAFRALTPAMAARGGHADALPADPPAGILLCDCEDEAALARIARWVADHRGRILAVGSAGLARALAARRVPPRAGVVGLPKRNGTALIVVGSQTPEAAAQVTRLAAGRDVLLLRAPAGRIDAERAAPTAAHAGITVLQAAADASGRAPAEVAADLARAAGHLIGCLPVALLIVTGGDTALAVLDALDVATVDLAGELLPGLPLARFDCGGRTLALVTKAGGFGDENVLVQALQHLGF